ncbi:MAG: hypothetical protein LBE13_03500 [Bacteroidales bacterium]|jgi:hypothetical protein|nr:hypothetical protein [Bacteroidales bacterium]
MKIQIKILVLFVNIIFFLSATAQNNIDGIYSDEYGLYELKIERDSLKLIKTDEPGYPGFILAECGINKIKDDFFELNSISPYNSMMESLKITKITDSIVTDSIKIVFYIPNRNNLKISLFTNTLRRFDLDYSEKNKEIILPNDIKTFSFIISSKNIISHNVEGQFFGVKYIDSYIEYKINNNTNYIKIEIPAIDDHFFERYYIKREYARIVNDSIIFKGEVFTKVK